VRYQASDEFTWRWRTLSRCAFIHLSHDLDFDLSDHNYVTAPYYAADEAVTMDLLFRGDENVVQGKHILAMFPEFFN